jgi:alpha-L-rhamnosidase
MRIHSLTCEYLTNPIGIDNVKPRLSWLMESFRRGAAQSAYQIFTAHSEEDLNTGKSLIWDSGKVGSSQNTLVPYGGPPPHSMERIYWKVRVWDETGVASEWSPPACWEMGLLDLEDWEPAKWIRMPKDTRNSPLSKRPVQTENMPEPQYWESYPSPMFRREFEARSEIKQARAYICGLGYYELYLNGQKVGDHLLDPAITTYDVRAFYVSYDITPFVQEGPNAIGVWLGNGFYGQNIAFAAPDLAWGPPTLLCKIVIDYASGGRDTLVSDGEWKVETGPILFDNVYAGETYDANLERLGWDLPGYDDTDWQSAMEVNPVTRKLQAQVIPPIKKIRTVHPVALYPIEGNKWIVDLGQNIAGWLRIKVREKQGAQITMRFAEAITPDKKALSMRSTGVFATGVEQTCIYVCGGDVAEVWEPRFTYHGFRYVEVAGLTHQPELTDFEGELVRNSVAKVGNFRSSDPLLNRIYQTALWTIEDNLHGISEDCPHREKCGWLGDAHVVAETSIFNFDMAQFWSKFEGDIETTLGRGGRTYTGRPATEGIPCNIAVGKRLCEEARPDWGVATVMLPWFLYLYYGDTKPLQEHYPLMKRWTEYVMALAKDHIVEEGYGDWCPPGGNRNMECPVELSSTAYQYETLKIMAQAAKLLGRNEDAARYASEAATTREAFNRKFLDNETKSYGSQTANALALRFDIPPEEFKGDVERALVRDIEETHSGHMFAGIHGAKSILSLLNAYEYQSLAFNIMHIPDYPGFNDLFVKGHTTMPEEFRDEIPGDPNTSRSLGSLNHPMQCGFAAWFHESVGGITPDPEHPGFKRFLIHPHNYKELDWAEVDYLSIHGKIRVEWRKEADRMLWRILIPVNTQATVWIPGINIQCLQENRKPITECQGISHVREERGYVVMEMLSGDYTIASTAA